MHLNKSLLSQAIIKCKSVSYNYLRQKRINSFIAGGATPWTSGYYDYKVDAIKTIISRNNFWKEVGSHEFGYRIDERVVEYPWLFSCLKEDSIVMLDAGSALNYDFLLDNSKLSTKKLFISTLSPENQAFWRKGISYVYEDLRKTCFREEFFDCIACISTLEHIGLDNTFIYSKDRAFKESDELGYLLLVDVLHSLLKEGGTVYFTFPYGRKKNYTWLQVFDDLSLDMIIKRFNPSSYHEFIFMYYNDRWNLSDREEAKDAEYYDIHTDKEYARDYCAAARAVAWVA